MPIESFVFGPEDGVPAAVAPFAQATKAAGQLWLTGQMPIDPQTGELVAGGIAEQTDQVMRNLTRVAELCGSDLDQAVQVRAYLRHFDHDYAEFNAAYEPWFPQRKPSRTCIGVNALALGALVEVDVVLVG